MKKIISHRLFRAVLMLFVLLLCLPSDSAVCEVSEPEAAAAKAPILFFYSDECADCHMMKRMIDAILSEAPELPIREICIEEEPEAWQEACVKADIPVWGVPRVFIGETVFAGWSEKDGELIYIPGYYGYMGYRNQVIVAMEAYLETSIPWIQEIPVPDSPASGRGCIGGC